MIQKMAFGVMLFTTALAYALSSDPNYEQAVNNAAIYRAEMARWTLTPTQTAVLTNTPVVAGVGTATQTATPTATATRTPIH